MSRGYFGIGVENLKTKSNLGTLWRSAYNFNADFLFTIGNRYKRQASDTVKAYRHIPFFTFDTSEEFLKVIPNGCRIVGIEIKDNARNLTKYTHFSRSIYILGAEDGGITFLDKCQDIIQINSNQCLNVAVAGSIIMYDRMAKVEL